MTKISENNLFNDLLAILPEDLIQQIRSEAQSRRMAKWEVADEAELVYQYSVTNYGEKYTYFEVCGFVAALKDYEYAPNSVKIYALTARQFTMEEREYYLWREVPFAHFRLAALAKNEGKDYQQVLEYSRQYVIANGFAPAEKNVKWEVATANGWSDWLGSVRKTENIHVTAQKSAPVPAYHRLDEKDFEEDPPIDEITELRHVLDALTGILPSLTLKMPATGKVAGWIAQAIRCIIEEKPESFKPPKMWVERSGWEERIN